MLSEPKAPYDELVQAMDAIRSAELAGGADRSSPARAVPDISMGDAPGDGATVKVALFTNIALGDAP